MSKIRSTDTRPEMKLRKYLHRLGFRYKLHYPVTGKPDLAFPNQKIAVFIHGCFWHQHGCKNSVMPKTNTAFWSRKLEGNVQRDKTIFEKLTGDGWQIRTIWECELEEKTNRAVNNLSIWLRLQSHTA